MEQVKFKNVAHLYLKVWGIVTGAENKEENGEWILTAQRLENFLRNQLKFKPILRRLDSMTEQEAVLLAKMTEWEPHFRNVKTQRNSITNDIIVTWDGANEGGESFNATGEQFYTPEQYLWLLSKHFDLFGLIESGEAIDANQSPINQ